METQLEEEEGGKEAGSFMDSRGRLLLQPQEGSWTRSQDFQIPFYAPFPPPAWVSGASTGVIENCLLIPTF